MRVFPTVAADTNLRQGLLRLIKLAGLNPWPKLWQNLRASAATDFAREFPKHVATAICGHSEQVAMEHYWQVMDSDLDAIITSGKIGAPTGAPILWQQETLPGISSAGASVQDQAENPRKTREYYQQAATGDSRQDNESGRCRTRTCDPLLVRQVL